MKIVLSMVCAIGLGVGSLAQEPAPPRGENPRLAIVNRTGNSAFGDLLFMGLAESGLVDLVERQETDRLLNEMEASAWALADSIDAGHRLNANGLLFVEADNDLVRMRLVETQRGEMMLATIRENKNADNADIVRDLLAAFRDRFDTLDMGEQERLYIALLPILADLPLAQDREVLRTFKILLEAQLSSRSRIVLVEREHLAEVIDERSEAEGIGADLSSASYVLRARAIRGTRLAVELSLQKTNTQESWFFQIELDADAIDRAARELAERIVQSLTQDVLPTADLGNEARNYFAKANVDQRAGRNLQAAEAHEIA